MGTRRSHSRRLKLKSLPRRRATRMAKVFEKSVEGLFMLVLHTPLETVRQKEEKEEERCSRDSCPGG